MGSGKGSPEGWVAVVKPGRVMFELAGVPEPLAREAMRLAGHKLPVKTKFVVREGAGRVKRTDANSLQDPELAEFIDNKRAGAVQPALPARHGAAREHRQARRRPSVSSRAASPWPTSAGSTSRES